MSLLTANLSPVVDSDARLRHAVDTMREMSVQTDPQRMVKAYAERMRDLLPMEGFISLSRRELQEPYYRITRSSRWTKEVNPWKQKASLPLFKGGLLADLIYGDQPTIIEDLQVSLDDPAYDYLKDHRTLIAIPHFHQGKSLNMVIHLRNAPAAFDRAALAGLVLMSNLFGRATQNLVLSDELKRAYTSLDRELKAVAEIQRSLLPRQLPQIAGLDLAAFYQTAHRAGGDYYDLFPLPNGEWGIFIADVSGHGTPAAVVMAITHSIAHAYPGPPSPPGKMLDFLNAKLCERYTPDTATFVTAFYGVFNPEKRTLHYACAGHNPPRLRHDGAISSLNHVAGLPLGIIPEETYGEATQTLHPNDHLLFYTDGITETFSAEGDMYGLPRLDEVLLNCEGGATEAVECVLDSVRAFAGTRAPDDDQTLLAAKIL